MVGEEERRERAGSAVKPRPAHSQSSLEDTERGDLLLIDLLNDFEELAALFRGEVQRGAWLDAYLLGCGMNQIVEDYLYTDAYVLRRGAAYLVTIPGAAGAISAGTARGIDATHVKLRSLLPHFRRIAGWQAELSKLIEQLALLVIRDGADAAIDHEVRVRAEMICEPVESFPAPLLRSLIRLPSCFRSFDQQPADLDRLVRRLIDRVSDSSTPITVVGVRTSGSYLAPLIAAILRTYGYSGVEVLTMRPGYPLSSGQRSTLRSSARRGGLVVLTDDPPATGEALAKASDELRTSGVPARSIVLFLQLFSSGDALPETLTGHPSALLPWTEWSVHEQMEPQAVQSALEGFLDPGHSVESVERLPLAHPPRSHAQGLYRVRVIDGDSQSHERHVHVSGTGLGYFGRHSLSIAKELPGLVPRVYGYSRGLLYRDWLPEERRLSLTQLNGQDASFRSAIEYVKARRAALRVNEDKSLRQFGRLPVWEVASNVLSQAFGRAWFLVRVPLLDRPVRRMLKVMRPSVVDGSMASSHWFRSDEYSPDLLKVDFDRRAFSNLNLYSYDSVFDLAALAADLDNATLAAGLSTDISDRLRAACEAAAGERVSPERWLLHQLVHVWDLGRDHHPSVDVRRAGARALQRYFGELFFRDVAFSTDGELCGLDLDGVLETEPLGFPALTGTSALALRSVLQHGYRPILVTGRSLAEVQDRCSAYKLAGGVAEYGAVAYNHHTRRSRPTITQGDQQALDRLREALRGVEGVFLDQNYHHAVRAYRADAEGRRQSLPAGIVGRLLAEGGLHDRIRPIPGDSQTDFVISRISKATGVRMLAADLGVENAGESDWPLALAVGDTVTDLPFLSLARLASAPGHAGEGMRRADVTVERGKYQAGLAQAVGRLLGHSPAGCPVCKWQCPSGSRLLLSIIGAQEQGPWSMLTAACSLAARNFRL
jgi:hydroxymethylpyrimidine pyrophosphatase-like HAD family hydrolase